MVPEGKRKSSGRRTNPSFCPTLPCPRPAADTGRRPGGCLERAVRELDTVTQNVREKSKLEDGAELVTDFERLLPEEKGIIDRGGLKQLTGVLKDIKDVLTLRSDADTREQEARIAKLQRDLDRETEKASVTVVLEGESGCYAE